MARWTRHFVIDVESDGPCPGLFNMISFGIVSLADPELGFMGEVAPIVDHPGLPEARAISGVSLQTQKTYPEAGLVMHSACEWLMRATDGERASLWSDNPAYDWQFWNWYCHKYVGRNPAGFSARRIGDLDAGRRGEPLNTTAWKHRRVTPHTHNPLDDARANAEGLRWVLQEMGETVDAGIRWTSA
jgi:hypothetical protein